MSGEIEIRDRKSGLKAIIYPAFGAMAGSVELKGRKVIYLDKSKMGLGNVLAGGVPILFPFAGRLNNDTYTLNNKVYNMPFHGFIKDMPFTVSRQTETSVTLRADTTSAIMEGCYPFCFVFQVTYEVRNSLFLTKITIDNRSDMEMIHSMGLHGYFAVSDKRRARLIESNTRILDEETGVLDPYTSGELDLSMPIDRAYCDPEEMVAGIENQGDGYRAVYRLDESFKTLVIYTECQGAVCIEPWIGIPDSVNLNKRLEVIQPKKSKTYEFPLEISLI